MKIALPIVGILMIVVGLIFSFQGAGILPGSPMTGVTFWLYVGIVMVIIGVVLAIVGLRARPKA